MCRIFAAQLTIQIEITMFTINTTDRKAMVAGDIPQQGLCYVNK